MDTQELNSLLDDVRSGTRSIEEASALLRRLPYADLGYARVDHHRELRQGMAEAVYGPGKTAEQCAAIVAELLLNGSAAVLLTRANLEQVRASLEHNPGGEATATSPQGEHCIVAWRPAPRRVGKIVILTAGTADLAVAAECRVALDAHGYAPKLIADCGVAGIHRLLEHYDELADADVIVVVAGMEGALASVVGGISSAPLIAVPSSVGYGSSLEGVTALLAMHASCAPGVTVVGIDNGFGAACAVTRILR